MSRHDLSPDLYAVFIDNIWLGGLGQGDWNLKIYVALDVEVLVWIGWFGSVL